jgi:peptidoglycan-associated lipoprotein
MNKPTMTLLATAALIAVAGCAKKKPADLPPPPPTETAPPQAPTPPPPVSNGVTPGSRADLLQQAGTDTVHFATDSSDVDSEAQTILTRHAAWLTKNPNVRVTIEGHCDERGTREYNLALGDRRANSAKNFLVNAGINAARISVISYGKERPIATGSDEASWAQNRRAVTVVPQ